METEVVVRGHKRLEAMEEAAAWRLWRWGGGVDCSRTTETTHSVLAPGMLVSMP